jgi:Bacterial archaeo-eukaryotic release factor family 3
MTEFTREALRELADLDLRPTVSILMPTHRAGSGIRQDPIRLKTLVREARLQLERQGLEDSIASSLLRPAEDLLEDRTFWRHQEDGLALFAGPNFFRRYRLGWPLREAALVGEHFWVKPLLPALATTERFYVLALSRHAVRLIEAGPQAPAEVDLGDLPRSVDEALRSDTPEQNLQPHVVTKAVRQFFHRVDDRVRRLMPDRETPLVVAALDYMRSIYREVNTHPGLVPQGLAGSPDGLSTKALAGRAWSLVRPRFERFRAEALERYENVGPRLTSTDLAAVLTAASQGRVADLFVATDVDRWGSFDPGSTTIQVRDRPGPGVEDLLNLAAVYTIERDGSVHAFVGPRVPGAGEIAASLRY